MPLCIHACSPDSDEDEIGLPPSYREGMGRRRKSVFAESYEPGEEDAAMERVCESVQCCRRWAMGSLSVCRCFPASPARY